MINSNLYALVMAGGQGTRFWPESTRQRPKQYLRLYGDKSLLEQTLQRFDGLTKIERRFLVTTIDQEKLAVEASGSHLEAGNIIFEPAGRNTAPCILLSLATLIERGAQDEDVVIICPADHAIIDTQGFQETLRDAFEAAVVQEKIVTIGIPPHCPHTGYGYIQKGSTTQENVFEVQRFVEKPDVERAKQYLESGDYLWNAGLFVSRIDVFLEQFKECAPEMFAHFKSLRDSVDDKVQTQEIYQKLEKISIDYAVMEKSNKVLVVPALFDWSDLGAWDALEDLYQKVSPSSGDSENLQLSALALFTKDSRGNLVWAPGKVVSLIGVNNCVVVSSGDKLLIMEKSRAQEVKDAVEFFSTHPEYAKYV
jgi:mannose-1-phosphate guanylyltransferase